MFTGIVEEVGSVVDLLETGDAARLRIRGPLATTGARHGDSIAVNGVCLTVAEQDGDDFTADLMAETLRRSALGGLRVGSPVNLERALAADGRLGGHIVQGHVDGVGRLISREPGEHWDDLRFELPAGLARYVVEKGSITVSGVSLTVTGVSAPGADEHWFGVSLIPTTLTGTTLGDLAPGDPVNLEVDVLAKYVERITAFAPLTGAHPSPTTQTSPNTPTSPNTQTSPRTEHEPTPEATR